MYNLNNSTIVASLTVGQLRELISEFLAKETRPVETEKKNLVYGLRGIMSLLHCSHTQAQRYKDGILKDAVMQNGRKIVVDAEKALELFNKSGRCLWLFCRKCSGRASRHNFVMLAFAARQSTGDPELFTSLPSLPSLPSASSAPSQDIPSKSPADISEPEPEGNEGNEGRLYMPTFYPTVKEQLPKFLKYIGKTSNSDADADILVLGALAVVSACLPGIYGMYNKENVFPNLFVFVTARAGSGKGRLNLCRNLVAPIHDELEGEYKKAMERYRSNLESQAQNDKQDKKTVAVRPSRRLVLLPANSSATAIYESLNVNGGFGLIFETEGDTLATSFGQDFGDFSDGLRKAFHHEPISYLRRGDEYANIKKPRLSTVLSGTPQQVIRLMSSVENGLFSRFLFYYLDKKTEWIDVFDEGNGEPLDRYFRRLGEAFLKLYHNLKERSGIRIKLTEDQKKNFNQHFSRLQADYESLFGEETIASVRRLGISTFRITMILTALRILEDKNYAAPRICKDEDFETAMAISEVLQQHMLRVIKELPAPTNSTGGNQVGESLRYQSFWKALPEEFEAKDFKAIAAEVGLSVPSAERCIRQWCETRLDKIIRGKYKKRA